MFTKPAVDLVGRGYGGGSFGRWKSRVRGLPEFGGELPVAAMAEEILTPGDGQIRALITSAGNPVLSTPNGRQLEKALDGLDFMVSIDFYLNETTRHADLILPPTAALERDHYDIVFHVLAIRNTSRYSPPLFEPEEGTRHDWQILHELRKRLDGRRTLRSRFERWLMGRGPRAMLDLGLRSGPTKLTVKKLEKAPHGVDLGALEPCLPERLKTRDGRIALAPELLVADVARLEQHLADLEDAAPMVLIGRRDVRTCNSWMHNYKRLMRGKDRCTLMIHPDDAERLGIADDGKATVSSRVGRIEAPVEVTDQIMRGVVSLPHGWGHDRPGIRLETASKHPGVSINDLTDEQAVDALCGNAAFSGVPVTVEPAS
jgi:anaerobic selenocysteine-containing dehydrogenase